MAPPAPSDRPVGPGGGLPSQKPVIKSRTVLAARPCRKALGRLGHAVSRDPNDLTVLGHLGYAGCNNLNDLIATLCRLKSWSMRGCRLGHLGQIVTPKKSLPEISPSQFCNKTTFALH